MGAAPGIQSRSYGSATWQNECDDGTFYTVRNSQTVPYTGIAGHAAPVIADLATKPVLYAYNQSSAKTLVPKFIRLRITAVGAGASTTDVAVFVDTNVAAATRTGGGTVVNAINQYPTYGLPVDIPVCAIGAVAVTPIAAQMVSAVRVRSVVPVVEDQYLFMFGGATANLMAGLPTTGTNQLVATISMPPVTVPPKSVFEFAEYGVTQSGAHSFDLEFGFVLR